MRLELNSPLTEEDWEKITDADMENTCSVTFETKHGEAEFVKVVRCKDCKKYRPIFKQALPLLGTCDICGIMRETDYCSMGERKEEQ